MNKLITIMIFFITCIGVVVTSYAEEQCKCSESPKLSGECFEVRGRMAFYNGTPTVRIWIVGTKRIVGVWFYNTTFPEELKELLTWENAVYADFTICPFADDKPGVMRPVCVESVKNITVRKWP